MQKDEHNLFCVCLVKALLVPVLLSCSFVGQALAVVNAVSTCSCHSGIAAAVLGLTRETDSEASKDASQLSSSEEDAEELRLKYEEEQRKSDALAVVAAMSLTDDQLKVTLYSSCTRVAYACAYPGIGRCPKCTISAGPLS